MKFVEPIRNLEDIKKIKKILKADREIRNLLLFTAGINFALRIGDLTKLQIKDLFEEDGSIKEFFYIKESKTQKSSKRTITDSVKEVLELYREKYPRIVEGPDNYLFFAQKTSPLGSKNIERGMGLLIVKHLTGLVNLKGNFGSHTLRKTYGYQARKADMPIELIQHKLNHSSIRVTERYLGITADEIEDMDKKLNL